MHMSVKLFFLIEIIQFLNITFQMFGVRYVPKLWAHNIDSSSWQLQIREGENARSGFYLSDKKNTDPGPTHK